MASSAHDAFRYVPLSEIQEDEEKRSLLSNQESSAGNGNPRRAGPPPGSRDNNNGRMKLAMARTINWLRRTLILSTRLFSLSKKSSATLMAYISTIAVMGIATLNIYSATYFLAWKKDSAVCHVLPNSTSSDKANSWIQFIVIGLPFACLPLALCIGSLAKVAEEETSYLGFVASMVMVEIIYIISLGAVMTLCMSDVSGIFVLIAAALTVVFLMLFWGCCCRYPKCWRHAVFCKCCCPDIDDVQVEELA